MAEPVNLLIDPGHAVLPQLIDSVAILALECNEAFAEAMGDSRWEGDLADPPQLTFDTTPPTRFHPHLLGTASAESLRWMWGWENINGLPDATVDFARDIRRTGESLGSPDLTTAQQPLDPDARQEAGLTVIAETDFALVLAALALSGIAAPICLRVTEGDGSRTWLLLDNPDAFSLPTATQGASLRAISSALGSGYVSDDLYALRAYAERREGATLIDDESGLLLRVSDGEIRIDLDENGRIAHLGTDADADVPLADTEPSA